MSKLTKKEKAFIQAMDKATVNVFRCNEHGIFALSKSGNDTRCMCCKKEGMPIVEPLNTIN